ncbi:MAG: PDZ domain-containing protein [Sulfurospirillum sp.]
MRSKGSSSDLRSVFPIMVARTFPEFGTNAGWIGSISGDDPTIAEIMRVSSDAHPCDLLHNDSFGGYSIRGVKFIPLTSEFMDAEFMEPFRLSKKEGVLVLDTSWQPPYKSNLNSAKEMGIQTNDIILAVNNKIINNPNVLIKEIQNTEDGGKISFLIYRDGKRINVSGYLRQ